MTDIRLAENAADARTQQQTNLLKPWISLIANVGMKRMLQIKVALIVCACISITGCISGRLAMSADPLEKVCDQNTTSGCAQGTTNLDKVHDLVQDSQTKCQAYITNLFGGIAGTNTSLDIIGTAFSAAATVFKPLTTVHALSAGSTLATGSKTSIQTEYMNSVTISHVIQAIDSTYGVKMQAYISYLDKVSNQNGIDVVAERSTILSYHGLCSLAAANGSIVNSLQPVAGQKSPAQLSTTYTVKSTDTSPALIATGIAAQVNGDAAFKAAGISAQAPGDTVTLIVPASLKVTWKHSQFAKAPGKSAATESAEFQDGPPTTIKITGTGQESDALTIETSTLAQAQGGAVAPPAQPPAPPPAAPTKLALSYTVLGTEGSAIGLASQILQKMNTDLKFHAAGITAAEHAGGPNGTIAVSVPAGSKLTWTQSSFVPVAGKPKATESVTFDNGPPPKLTIDGALQNGDKLTIVASVSKTASARVAPPPAAQSPEVSPTLPESGIKPPAAVPGAAVWQQ
jgi:LysM repeat protein